MKVLVIGSGGREDALVWALARSRDVKLLRCAPGNAGTARRAENVPIEAGDSTSVVEHCRREAYDLVVVGPEVPLVAGLADRLAAEGIAVFGPAAGAALLEGSKVFAKEFMERHGIPTARFRAFSDADAAAAHLRSADVTYPVVIKADGLAAGKGVILASGPDEAEEVTRGMLGGALFGDAGRRIVLEERLVGREASFFVLSDGERFVELATCQDYKRVGDGDTGSNTGGMGSYSPSAYLDEELRGRLRSEIVEPTIAGLAVEGRPYRGVLYVGVMLTRSGPKVLEFNCRFGDPETQVLLPRLDGDWLPLLLACASGDLVGVEPRWKEDAAVCVVMASGGYPGPYEKGHRIQGLEEAERMEGVEVFHAGTRLDADGVVVTAGGRVLGVTGLAATVEEARALAYRAAGRIHWKDVYHRTDIALDAVGERESG